MANRSMLCVWAAAAAAFSSSAVLAGDDQCGFWQPMGQGATGGTYPIQALKQIHDPATGAPVLAVGGGFTSIGGSPTKRIAIWNGSSWSALGTGVVGGPPLFTGSVTSIVQFDDGGGEAIYIAGSFITAGDAPALNVAKWRDNAWSAVGEGFNNGVTDLEIFDDGSGPHLYAAGGFTMSGRTPMTGLARWNGVSWEAVGAGTAAGIVDLQVFDDDGEKGPNPPALYACGGFTTIGGVPAPAQVAKCDGAAWSAVGGVSLAGFNDTTSMRSMTSYDDGDGPHLYCALYRDHFDVFHPTQSGTVYKWNGVSWSSIGNTYVDQFTHNSISRIVGVGVGGTGDPSDPAAPGLFAGGNFNWIANAASGSIYGSGLAAYRGGKWHSVEGGVTVSTTPPPPIAGEVRAIEFYDSDDGGGPRLIVGGGFWLKAGPMPTKSIAQGRMPQQPYVPVIDAQPQDQSANAGTGGVSFSVQASGSVALSYKWRKNGVNLVDGPGVSGAKTPQLLLTSISAASVGAYDVVVSNECGDSVTSDPAALHFCGADVAPLGAGDGAVDIDDLFAVINAWGRCGNPTNCPADIAPAGGNDVVDVDDLFAVINGWGPCP